MLKKLLNLNEKESKKYDLVVRPFIVYCVALVIMVIMNTVFKKMTPDLINGYIGALLLFFVINYLNLTFIEIKELEKND